LLKLRSKHLAVLVLCISLGLAGCKEDKPIGNFPPETHLSLEKINLSGDLRLNSSVYLSWYGTDKDGVVVGYEYSTNQTDWFFTERRDSTFKFPIPPGIDTTDIRFYIRAIDDQDLTDPSPAELTIPLRNSKPTVEIDEESFPADTAFSVITFRWNYGDPDGDQTVIEAYIKANDGDWHELDRSKPMISIRPTDPKATGTVDANVYYNTDIAQPALTIDGLNNGSDNVFYLKVVDFAGTESIVDTSETIFLRAQTSDLLMIGGQPPNVNARYQSLVGAVYPDYDLVDFALDNGQYQPKYWNPTFSLLTELYDKVFFNCDQSLFTHPITGQSALLLEFAAPVLQNYSNKGGKSFITTSFPAGLVPTELSGALPIDSLSLTSGQAVVRNDSFVVGRDANWKNLQPKNLILGLDPFVPSIDAEPIYTAQISTFGAWEGPNVVGAIRKKDGNINQLFFSIELYRFDNDPAALNDVFDYVLNTALNW